MTVKDPVAPMPSIGLKARSRTWRLGPMKVIPTLPLVVLFILVFGAVAAPVLTPYSPVKADLINNLQPPFWVEGGSMAHPLGTDTFGRDSFSRLLYGARVSLSVAFLALLIAGTIGTSIGLLAGYAGGWIDSVLMRFVDMVLSLPTLLIALAMAIALGPSFTNIVLVIGFLIWPRVARLIRGETMLVKQQEFVRYARAVGVPGWLIVIRHVVPNVMATILVAATLEIGHVILVEASLSFLGAGIPAPEPSWGVMISDGRALIATGWWIALFPGLAIVASVITFNTLGDWLRDVLDPRLREV